MSDAATAEPPGRSLAVRAMAYLLVFGLGVIAGMIGPSVTGDSASGGVNPATSGHRPGYPVAPDVGVFPPDADAVNLPDRITPAWQQRVRDELTGLLQPGPRDAAAVTVEEARRPADVPARVLAGLTGRWWSVTQSDGVVIRASVVERVHGRALPGLVVALHGHGDEGMAGLFRAQSQRIAIELAHAGFRVLAVETRGFGGSPTGGLGHYPYVQRLRLQGHEFHGRVLADNRAVLDHALGVFGDDGPIAVVGLSMGGLAAMFLGACDPRVDVVDVAGMGGSFRNSFSSVGHCECSIIPGLLRRLDSIHIFAAMHARHIALELGEQDHSLGVANTRDMFDDLQRLEDRRDVQVTIHTFAGGHAHDPPFVVRFLERAFASLATESER